ncbi:MAG: DUF362 domain-containing protein [Candidatus Heimdallarchaeota archaeon]
MALIQTDSPKEGLKAIFVHYSDLFTSLRQKIVVIKPNFNTADPPPASTDIQLLRQVIEHIKGKDPKKIIVAERAGPANTYETMRIKGLYQLQEDIGGFNIVDLSSLPEHEWIHIRPEGSHWRDGFLFPKLINRADAFIALPCLKTHRFGGHFTLSLKLAVGLVPRQGYSYMKELHSSPHQRRMIAEINQVFNPTLVIMDGIKAFVDGGPERGTLMSPNVMLASPDRIAIDAVGVAILRDCGTTKEVSNGPIFRQEQIARAVELGIGVSEPEKIEIKALDVKSQEYVNKLHRMLIEDEDSAMETLSIH